MKNLFLPLVCACFIFSSACGKYGGKREIIVLNDVLNIPSLKNAELLNNCNWWSKDENTHTVCVTFRGNEEEAQSIIKAYRNSFIRNKWIAAKNPENGFEYESFLSEPAPNYTKRDPCYYVGMIAYRELSREKTAQALIKNIDKPEGKIKTFEIAVGVQVGTRCR